jgi:murein DD-endopeptidase MepM/ murein hydrolase activator NlpD
LLFSFCCGCATTSKPYLSNGKASETPGLFHRLERGQTLWRISKKYNVDLDELVRINKIQDVDQIEVGQLIFIPAVKATSGHIAVNKSEDFIWPLKGKVISYFGQTNNYLINKGLNIKPMFGSFVVASRTGVVSFYTEGLGNLGKTIIVDHGDGYLTVYARIGSVLVKVGQNVSQGQQIAKLGHLNKDKDSYLHFEIRKGHMPQNPYHYLR